QQEHLYRHAGAERNGDAPAAGGGGVVHVALQHLDDRGGGCVSGSTQRLPRPPNSLGLDVQRGLDGREHAWTAGMDQPERDVFLAEAVLRQEAAESVTAGSGQALHETAVQDREQALVREPKSEDIPRIWNEKRRRIHHFDAALRSLAAAEVY